VPELLWVIAVLLMIGAAAAIEIVPWPIMLEFGNDFMLSSAALGVPLELLYFMALAWTLGYSGVRPPGWYWRSFKHHHLLGPRQRWIVLPLFYAGALSFLAIVLGIAIAVLGMISAVLQ